MAGEKDLYGTFGSVPENVSENATGAGPLSARATPESFGANVGGAIAQAGEQAMSIAQKYQGMQNETLATNADAALSERLGAIKGQFKSLSGQEAVNALPGTIASMNQVFQETRAKLPPMAAQGFDSMAKRSLGYGLGEMNEYAAGQYKAAANQSAINGLVASYTKAKDPDVAVNDEQFGNVIGDIKHLSAMTIDPDHPGLSRNSDGVINGYKDNSEGQTLKSTYNNMVDHYTGLAWQNRFDALTDSMGPIAADNKFQEDKWQIPPLAAADISAKLIPQVNYSHSKSIADTAQIQAQQEHAKILLNPQVSNGPNAFNLGNVKTASGAANNTQEFINPSTPVDGAILTANNLIKNYQGMTLQQVASKWAPSSENDTSSWVKNVSSASGIDPNVHLDMNDPTTLTNLLKGIAVAEKSPKDRAAFTDDVISQGVQGALSGKQAATMPQSIKPYATTADGAKYNTPDYYADHKEEILTGVREEAERLHPGNLAVANGAVAQMRLIMDSAISDQKNRYIQDNKYVSKGIFGQDGQQPPQTMDQLMAQPGMKDVLVRVASQDPKFYEGIPKMLEQVQRGNEVANSKNGYETVLRVLQPNDAVSFPNRISSQDHLDKLLGRSDGTGINAKDYNDAKKSIEYPDNIKDMLSKQMRSITNANGNVDGNGQERAMMWYNQAVKMKDSNDISKKLSDVDLIKNMESSSPDYMPSRVQQIAHLARLNGQPVPQQQPTPETVTVVSPQGRRGVIPASQLDEAIKSGYKKAE